MMTGEQEKIDEILHHLTVREKVNVLTDHAPIELRQAAGQSHISLKTEIYRGDNYIPKSVRDALKNRQLCPFSHLATFFTIEENVFTITLNHIEEVQPVDSSHFEEVLHEFHDVAEKWRLVLNERDRNDLIYIHSRTR